LEQAQPDSASNFITLRDGHSRNHGRLPARDPIYMNGTSQSGGHLVLHVEKIGALLVEAFGPQMPAALGIDELRVEADPFARVLHAAFENIAYAELAADLAGVDRLALICKSGVARDREDA